MSNLTIPALPIWGVGPNPLTGNELFVISPSSSTATPSSQLSLLHLANFPMILPAATQAQINLNPTGFFIPAYSVGSASPVSITPNQIAVSGGGVPAGGTTGQALIKNSNTNFDDTWGSVAVPGGGSGLGSVAANAMLYGNGTAALGVTNTGICRSLVRTLLVRLPLRLFFPRQRSSALLKSALLPRERGTAPLSRRHSAGPEPEIQRLPVTSLSLRTPPKARGRQWSAMSA